MSHGFERPESGPHGALGVIFMRQGVAEVDQQAIAEILGDMPLKAGDHLGAGVLIGPHHLAQVFRIELTGKSRGVHQVTEQHGELAAFRLWRSGSGWRGGRHECVVMQERGQRTVTRPDEDAPLFIHREPLAVDELILERLQGDRIELELELEGAIRQAARWRSRAIA